MAVPARVQDLPPRDLEMEAHVLGRLAKLVQSSSRRSTLLTVTWRGRCSKIWNSLALGKMENEEGGETRPSYLVHGLGERGGG